MIARTNACAWELASLGASTVLVGGTQLPAQQESTSDLYDFTQHYVSAGVAYGF
jgi:hypothetical protein